MPLFSFPRRVRHPLFPNLAAIPAAHARGHVKAAAGSVEELLRAAESGLRVQHAVFALLAEDEFLDDGQRDDLWNLFQVPVFGLRLDSHGGPVAWECEAQNGMHCGTHGSVSDCPCGRSGPRTMPAASLAHAAD